VNKGFEKSWQLTLLVMLLVLLGSLFALIPVIGSNMYLLMIIGELLIALPIYLGCRYLKRHHQSVDLGFRTFSLCLLIPLFFLPSCMQQFFTVFTYPLQEFLINTFGEIPEAVPVAKSVSEFLWQFVAICVAAPVLEEVLCRGVMIQLLKPYGLSVTLVTSAAAFSILHFDIRQIPVIFFLGVMLGVVRLLTGSLWACIFVHSANNFCSLILQILIARSENFAYFALLGVILFPVFLLIFLRQTKRKNRTLKLQKIQDIRISASFVLCWLMVLGYNTFLFFHH